MQEEPIMNSGWQASSARWIWVAGFVLLIGTIVGASYVYSNSHGSAQQSTGESSQTEHTAMSLGYIDSEHGITNLYPTQHGTILQIRPEGFHAKKGEWLIKMDNRLAKLRLQEAESMLEKARKLPEQFRLNIEEQTEKINALKHQKKANEYDLAIAERGAKEASKDIGEGAAKTIQDRLSKARELAKQIDCQIAVEESKLTELKLMGDPSSDIKRAQSVYDQAKLGVDECDLVAPTAGTVLRVLVHVGESLGPNPKFPALQFAQDGKKICRAEILQEWAVRFKEKQTVDIVDDTYNGVKWTGTITHISPWYAHKRSIIFEPFTFNDARSLECIIEVNEKDDSLRFGQRVRVGVRK
jgi:multidrug resistance efflux pump